MVFKNGEDSNGFSREKNTKKVQVNQECGVSHLQFIKVYNPLTGATAIWQLINFTVANARPLYLQWGDLQDICQIDG